MQVITGPDISMSFLFAVQWNGIWEVRSENQKQNKTIQLMKQRRLKNVVPSASAI